MHLCPPTGDYLRFSAVIEAIKLDADRFKCIFMLHETPGANRVLRFFFVSLGEPIFHEFRENRWYRFIRCADGKSVHLGSLARRNQIRRWITYICIIVRLKPHQATKVASFSCAQDCRANYVFGVGIDAI